MEDVHPNCSFGCNTSETIEHLLITCPYAKSVWAIEPNLIYVNPDNTSSFLEICKTWIRRLDSGIPIEIILTKAWFIWKERCNRVFEQKQQTKTPLGLEIQRFLDFWYKSNMPPTQFIKGKLKIQNWSLPNTSQFKLNIDAAWISLDFPAGFSLILRNDVGDFELGRAGPFTASSPEKAEAIGLLQSVNWAVEKGLSNFTVEGDLPRTANNVADVLAKEAKSCS
ncbi:uncharacterized protein LOC113352598 [Papaver somniferum]|uniref:uncharacterized protein LOC113352598 n=1 Tax=Papaver somniferum TaxID=3469 RepID=UPI000E6FD506|nr:uncharacterized protein LOC113352598 [Papaver somniferum]